jgi:hypothetical protein
VKRLHKILDVLERERAAKKYLDMKRNKKQEKNL